MNTIITKCKNLGANQITFRELYTSVPEEKICYLKGEEKEVNEWINAHKASNDLIVKIRSYITKHGHELEVLPFGAVRYSVEGMSTVLDDDCMSGKLKQDIKYLILRPNCKDNKNCLMKICLDMSRYTCDKPGSRRSLNT